MEDSVAAPTEYKPDLAKLKRMVQESMDASQVERQQSAIDEDYYDGPGQWTREERATLRLRKQPDNYFNRIRPAINGTLGVIKQGSTDPKAYPRNPQDEDSADVASKTLRFIADFNRFDDVKLKGAKEYLVPGIGAMIIEVDEDRQIVTRLIRYDEFFRDPRSRREDFKDAKYMGVAKWQYADDVVREHPKAKADIERQLDGGSPIAVDSTMEDKPTSQTGSMAWGDKKMRRVMVVEIYHEEGGRWYRCLFHGGGILDAAESPYQDDKKRPCNPIEAQSCYVDRENNRYGIVRDMRGPQDEINKRRSKLLHRLSTNLVQENQPGAMMATDAELVRKEAARPDGVLPSGVQIVSQADKASGESQLLAEAKAEIERMGPNPAVLGRTGESQSGRANLIRQQAGMTEQAIIFGGIEDWELRVYRQMWNRARQFWTAPMFIRVTDDEGAPEFIGVNQPKGQDIMDPATGQPAMDPESGEPMKGHPILDPVTGVSVLGYENQLAELDVDIIIDTVPDTANVQQEQFQVLAELAKLYPQQVSFDEMVELSTLQNKRAFLEKRKTKAEEAAKAQQPNPQQQAGMAEAQAKIAKLEAEAQHIRAQTAEIMTQLHMTVHTPMQGPPMGDPNMPPPGSSGAEPFAGA